MIVAPQLVTLVTTVLSDASFGLVLTGRGGKEEAMTRAERLHISARKDPGGKKEEKQMSTKGRLVRRIGMTATVVVMAGAFWLPGRASAATTVTMGTTAQLVNRVYAVLTVTATCSTADFPGGIQSASVGANISQATGRTIASGSWDTYNVTCDGTAHTYQAIVQPGNGVFHAGPATASANAFVCGYSSSGGYSCDSPNAGPSTITITSR